MMVATLGIECST